MHKIKKEKNSKDETQVDLMPKHMVDDISTPSICPLNYFQTNSCQCLPLPTHIFACMDMHRQEHTL